MNAKVPAGLLEVALRSIERLLDVYRTRYDRAYNLATGDLGFVVAADLATRITGNAHYQKHATDMLARAWEVGCRSEVVGLLTGRAGLAWTVGRHPHLATKSMHKWCDEFLESVLDADGNGLRRIRHFDFVDGAAGVLVAASVCHTNTEPIANHMIDWCIGNEEALRVHTPARRTILEANVVGACVENWGVAHGLPGILGALQICQSTITTSRIASARRRAERATRLMIERFGPNSFPSYLIDGEPVASKHAAWCYGALPVMLLLSHATMDDRLRANLAPWETPGYWRTRIAANGRFGLCHGAAGIGLLLSLLALKAGSQALWNNGMDALRNAMQPPHADLEQAIDQGLLLGRLGPAVTCLSLACRGGGPIPELLGLQPWEPSCEPT